MSMADESCIAHRAGRHVPQGMFLSRIQSTDRSEKESAGDDKEPTEAQTFPQAPSPTITSFLRISAMLE